MAGLLRLGRAGAPGSVMVMATTPVYGWPYQSLTDAPNGADLGEDLALGIEATLAALAAQVTTLQSDVAALQTATTYTGSAWVNYVPSWVSLTGVNPTVASHTLGGRYKRIDAKLAVAQISVIFGASGYGTGVYQFGLPFATAAEGGAVGAGHALNAGIAEFGLTVWQNSTTTVRCTTMADADLTNAAPFTFGNADQLFMQILFEPA